MSNTATILQNIKSPWNGQNVSSLMRTVNLLSSEKSSSLLCHWTKGILFFQASFEFGKFTCMNVYININLFLKQFCCFFFSLLDSHRLYKTKLLKHFWNRTTFCLSIHVKFKWGKITLLNQKSYIRQQNLKGPSVNHQ